MPQLAAHFADQVDDAVGLAIAGELAWLNSPPNSVTRRELRGTRMTVLYEMSYLRIFVGWEIFLEETFVRMMCGWESPLWSPRLKSTKGTFSDLKAARTALYGNREYLLWHNPEQVIGRCSRWFDNGIYSRVLASNEARLEWFAAVRHRIAHGGAQVRTGMDSASNGLAGKRYPASSAGRFLRDWRMSDPLSQERWLKSIADELTGLAFQLSP
jgi:hypothetical protein